MASRRKYVVVQPGDRAWREFCVWVRDHLYLDRDDGYVRYRPRDSGYFSWSDDPDVEARRWNAANAGRAIMVASGRRWHGFVHFDGCWVSWKSVKEALGVFGGDMNRGLPNPDKISDREVAEWYGLDYALWRCERRKRLREKQAAAFSVAVEKMEARIGRALTKMEKEEARKACKVDT